MPISNANHGRLVDFYQHMRQSTWTGDATVENVQKQWFPNLLYQTDSEPLVLPNLQLWATHTLTGRLFLRQLLFTPSPKVFPSYR